MKPPLPPEIVTAFDNRIRQQIELYLVGANLTPKQKRLMLTLAVITSESTFRFMGCADLAGYGLPHYDGIPSADVCKESIAEMVEAYREAACVRAE